MYSDNLSLLHKSVEDAKLDAKLWHSRTEDGVLDELLDEGDDDVLQLEESATTLGFHEEIQLFRRSLVRTLQQVCDIVPNPSLYKFVHDRQPINCDDMGYCSHVPLDLQRRLDSYLQDMSDE